MTSTPTAEPSAGTVATDIPARLDRLPWSPFHTRVLVALGSCWVLDGFEITIASNIGEQLRATGTFGLSGTGIGLLASVYLAGEVVGALLFGQLADRWGRRRLFFVTLSVYMVGSALTAAVPGHGTTALVLLGVARFVAGMGIGGEYAAINSMVDELIPAVYRGRADLIVNGTYWFGAAVAAVAQVFLSGAIDQRYGWRVALLIGPVLALGVWFLRKDLPESPRWQVLHGEEGEARRTMDRLESEIRSAGGTIVPPGDGDVVHLRPEAGTGYRRLLVVLFRDYPDRAVLGAVLMITQSVLYNAVFFIYASVLVRKFDVEPNGTALYILPFAIGNLLGPIVLGPLFDRVGRRKMLARTYGLAGVLLLGTAVVVRGGGFDPLTQTLAYGVVFFFASAGASAAYLTISEVFPLEVRAKAIAAFFALIQSIGAFAPVVFGSLIDQNGDGLFVGYLVGAGLMLLGALVARVLAVDAENKSLEWVAPPLALVVRRVARPRALGRHRRGGDRRPDESPAL